MSKKILYQGVPQQVLSESLGAIYPETLDKQENGQLVAGAQIVVPYDPNTGVFAACTLYNPSTKNDECQRTPTVFKRGIVTTLGSTALWTPAAGKRFRLMGYSWSVPNTATSAAGTTFGLLDTAAGICYLSEIGTTTAGINGSVTLPGNGYLSVTVGGVLNVNLTAALTVGELLVSAWGTEE